jgi:hypothetical protein
MAPQVSVIILNWNGRHLLPACLAALDSQTLRDFEVVVVDNGSHDGSTEWLAAQFPTVRLIRNATNLGFAAANNQGIRVAQAPLIMLLNNDAYLAPDCLQKLVEAAAGASWAGMFACKILQHDAPDHMDSAGIEVDRAGIAWNRGWGEPIARHAQALEVFGPSAAAALYRRAMLDQIGLLDDDFFIYYEDVDLAWRAQWAGWRCLYVPEAEARHVHSATTGRGSAFKARLLGRNKWWAILKDYPFAALAIYVPLMAALDLGAALAGSWRGRNLGPVRGRLAALRAVRKVWRQRGAVQHDAPPNLDWRKILAPLRLRRYLTALH